MEYFNGHQNDLLLEQNIRLLIYIKLLGENKQKLQ